MAVVMINEDGERTLEMTRVRDQQPVQTFGPGGPNEPFGDPIRLGHLNRRTHSARALRLKHRVEVGGELGVVIAKQEPNGLGTLSQPPRDLARLLSDPLCVGMCRAAR